MIDMLKNAMKSLLIHSIKRWPSPSIYHTLQKAYHKTFLAVWYFGTTHYCPICKSRLRKFLTTGTPPHLRVNTMCPVCASEKRHRLIWLFLRHETNLFSLPKKRMLHVAPEFCFEETFSQHPAIEYVSVDLCSPSAMLKMDVTDMYFADNTFDAMYASHILEHIEDDRKAMQELYRVLKPGGWAILQVPIEPERETTYEDPKILSPAERERAFGQSDHVRIYGKDYYERLQAAGFQVHQTRIPEQADAAFIHKFGLDQDETITFCIKNTRS